MKSIVTAGLVLVAALCVMIFSFMWFFCRIQVEPGYMAIVTAKVGKDLPPNEILAAPGEKGVQRDPLPEGRHFLNPHRLWRWITATFLKFTDHHLL